MKKKTEELNKSEEQQVQEELKPMLNLGHKPKTRRDFLAQGFLGSMAFALAPSALDLLVGQARAQVLDCPVPSMSTMTPVIIIDLAGGGNIAGSNVMVGGQGGQMDFLANYASLGLPPNFHPSLMAPNTEFGLAFHPDSGMLRGMQQLTATTTRANVDGAIFCTTSSDDTGNNQSNPIYWLNKAGATGQLEQLAGTQASPSGGNSQAPSPSINPALQPVKVSSNQDAVNLVSLGNRFAGYSSKQIDALLNASGDISNGKLGMIDRRSLPENIKKLIACGYSQTPEQIKRFSLQNVEPNQDTVATSIFAGVTNADMRNRSLPITKLVLDGIIGVGTITLGGYDYHNGSRTEGDTKDQTLGQIIGAILELAARKQKDVVVYVLTDGGVSGPPTPDAGANGKYIWTGDSGERSATFMLVYKKDGRPGIRTADKRQIGWYKPSGAVEAAALLTSNSTVNASKAMVANYLALHGKEGTLEAVVGDDPFRTDLDKYLVFNKLR